MNGPFYLPKCSKILPLELLGRHFGLPGVSLGALWSPRGRPLGLLALSWGTSGAAKAAFWSLLAPAGLPKWIPGASEAENFRNLMLFAVVLLSFSAHPTSWLAL